MGKIIDFIERLSEEDRQRLLTLLIKNQLKKENSDYDGSSLVLNEWGESYKGGTRVDA
jgi:hypothetical protein